MTRVKALILAIAILFVPAMTLARQPELAEAWNGAQINWRSLQSGVKEATATGKSVVLVFHASWCSACKKYREVFKDTGIVEASRNYVMVLVDVDKDPTANGAFAPDGTYVPRTLFISPEGDVRSDLVSTADPEHPHSIDNKSPAELLSLMQRGLPDGHNSGKPILKDFRQDASAE